MFTKKTIMKKFLLLLILVYGCNKEPSHLKEIQSIIKSTLNNPESFEFASFTLIDTTYYKEFYEKLKESYLYSEEHHREMIISYQGYADNWRAYIKKYPKRKNEFEEKAKEMDVYVEENSEDLKAILNIIKNNDSTLSTIIDEKKILEIEGLYKFRTLNEYNAKVLKSYKVFFNDSLKVRSYEEVVSK
tara:strand:- start:83 stop:646 length:564 start_codon:yes stop_codon:yes gene_type:complete